MKLTQIRFNKDHKQVLKTLSLDELMEAVGSDNQYSDIQRLRDFTRYAGEYSQYQNMYRLPVVFPSVQLHLERNVSRSLRAFNGLLTLSVGPLADADEAERIKEAVRQLPMTVCALLGSSGKTVKVVVAIAAADGSLPQDEQQAERLCQQALPLLCQLYQVAVNMAPVATPQNVVPAERKGEGSVLMTGFRMTADSKAFYRRNATPLLVSRMATVVMPGIAGSVAPAVEPSAPSTSKGKSSTEVISQQTQQLIRLLDERYAFRMNTIMGYVECRPKKDWYQGWRPVDESVQNGLAMEARLAGLNVWDKDVARYLKSNMVRPYNPIEEYLWNLHDQWDGKDYIGALADRVPTRQKMWRWWFRTWFLAMVAQWQHSNPRYGNSLAPLLISAQGYNKSTFCRMLLPPELRWGYNDNLVLSEKKSVLQAMGQFLLVNLDEFNQISPRVQEGFLKNLIQLASVKVKRPYGRHVEDFPRLASFIATANVSDILSDPSGNRRFIGIELTGPIDVTTPVNYTQLYAQAVALLEQGERCWLDEEQTRQLIDANQQFQLHTPEELYFGECFRLPQSDEEGEWMTAAAIHQCIKKVAGSALHGSTLQRFSRVLYNMPALQHRRTRSGSEYLVVRKK